MVLIFDSLQNFIKNTIKIVCVFVGEKILFSTKNETVYLCIFILHY